MADTKDAISTLNSLAETCADGAEGFKQAADGLQSPKVKEIFRNYSQQRERFATELRSEVERLGGSPATGGSASGAAHRGWINIKSAVTGRNDDAIIAEAERGEDVAVEAYQKALKADVPLDVQSKIQQQYGQVKAAHDQVRDMKHGKIQY